MLSREFLANAKMFSNGIDSDLVWLVDCNKKTAVICNMEMFLAQNFTNHEEPTAEKYAGFIKLIRREIDLSEPQFMAAANQAAIQTTIHQLLSVATPLLAALIEVNEEKRGCNSYSIKLSIAKVVSHLLKKGCTTSSESAVPRDELVKLALAYAENLIIATNKRGGNS